VLKLSGEYGVDLSLIQGTGAGGRVTRKDVLAFAKEGQVGHTIQTAQVPPIQQPAREISIPEAHVEQQNWSPSYNQSIQARSDDQMIPASTVRKTIASRMIQSKQEIPHAWTMIECDVTNLVNYREKIKDDFKQKEGINLTYLPFFIKAVVEAIKEFPIINSQWSDGQIIMKKRIHISLAVATEEALYVPVIKDADQRSILGLAKVMDDLVTRTREGKLTVEDMAGGTFTVNNTGSFGSIQSAPIINYPQAAILSVEAIVKRPVVIHNMIAIRDMVNLCLSLDHRVLDGLVCGRFLQSIKNRIESYGLDTNMY
ncbi:MAG TPA: dihydrolipoamide acetyltransferase family protein, partial [Bacillota bacterium]|nr:dihydrolipoamide acetyltransferase family protein [Bacillota bacterium]